MGILDDMDEGEHGGPDGYICMGTWGLGCTG